MDETSCFPAPTWCRRHICHNKGFRSLQGFQSVSRYCFMIFVILFYIICVFYTKEEPAFLTSWKKKKENNKNQEKNQQASTIWDKSSFSLSLNEEIYRYSSMEWNRQRFFTVNVKRKKTIPFLGYHQGVAGPVWNIDLQSSGILGPSSYSTMSYLPVLGPNLLMLHSAFDADLHP